MEKLRIHTACKLVTKFNVQKRFQCKKEKNYKNKYEKRTKEEKK